MQGVKIRAESESEWTAVNTQSGSQPGFRRRFCSLSWPLNSQECIAKLQLTLPKDVAKVFPSKCL